jgi:NDP-sugar pyrophosphorylase family protein
MDVQAVVIAAGEGRRMRPLTDRWPKALLPIDRRPVLATLLRELASAGIGHVTIVVGSLGGQIEQFVGDGSRYGLEAAYARQPEPLGSAHAVRCALATGVRAPLLVTAADTVYRSGDLRLALARFLESRAAGGLGVRPVPVSELPDRSRVVVEAGRVLQVVEKPDAEAIHAPTALAAAPLWFVAGELGGFVEDVAGPPFELARAFQTGIDAGRTVVAIELGPTRDLTRPADVLLHNFPYLWSVGGGCDQ